MDNDYIVALACLKACSVMMIIIYIARFVLAQM
jgi:hypothetical protein